jgi:HEAT repeat protein/tRNA A-37 threonylcarbamoyl transferase component Bud32
VKICPVCHRIWPDANICPEHGIPLQASLTGLQLGSYRVLDVIGQGGLGVVYEAEHVQIGRKAAVKVIRPEFVSDHVAVERFLKEARTISSLRHPNLIDIFDIGRLPSGEPYYTMELLQGRSLATRMQQGPLDFAEFAPLLIDACDALDTAHRIGIIHRDLKPDNLFLVERPGSPAFMKVLDFGVAKFLDGSQQDQRLTQTGMIVGTPLYMAPEQIEGAPVDARADVYSLGVVLYELATGQLPFRGETIGALLKAHIAQVPPAFDAYQQRPGVPAELEAVVLRALRKAAAERYGSMAELKDELASVMEHRPTGALRWWEDRRATLPPTELPALIRNTLSEAAGQIDEVSPEEAAGLVRRPIAPKWIVLGVAGALTLGAGALVVKRVRPSGPPRPVAAVAAPPADEAAKKLQLSSYRSKAMAILTAGLKDGDPAIRAMAIACLSSDKDARHGSLIEPLLDDADPAVRDAAAQALADLGARASIPALQAAAKAQKRPASLLAAATSLGDEASARALHAILKRGDDREKAFATVVMADRDKDARKLADKLAQSIEVDTPAAVTMLGTLARKNVAAARTRLASLLGSAPPPLKIVVAEQLASLGDDRARQELTELAGGSDAAARLLAYRALAELDDASGYDYLLSTYQADARALGERIAAAQALGTIGERRALTAFDKPLESAEMPLRVASAGAALSIVAKDPSSIVASSIGWASTALSDSSIAVRENAVAALGNADPSVAVPLLGRALDDQDPRVREAAARSLGKTRTAHAVEVLSRALADREKKVRVTALRSMGAIGEGRAKPILTQHLAKAAKDERVVAAGQLVKLGDRSHVGELVAALRAPEPEVRKLAVEEAVADQATAHEVADVALKDASFAVRLQAALKLAENDSPAGESVLQEALTKHDASSVEAYAALLKLKIQPKVAIDANAILASDQADARHALVRSAAIMPWSDASPILTRALDDADATLKLDAVDALERQATHGQSAAALPILKHASASADEAVRAKAGLLLARLGPKDASSPPAPVTVAPTEPAANAVANADAGVGADGGAAAGPVDLGAPPDLAMPPRSPEEEAQLALTAGELALKAGRLDAAARELTRAHRLNPRLPVDFSIGEVYRKMGDAQKDLVKRNEAYKKAIASYRKAKDHRGISYAAELEMRLNEK